MWSSHSSVPRGAGAVSDAAVLAASAHLTGRDRRLVRLVAEHRVLTTGQLCALWFDSPITARHRLAELERLGLLRRPGRRTTRPGPATRPSLMLSRSLTRVLSGASPVHEPTGEAPPPRCHQRRPGGLCQPCGERRLVCMTTTRACPPAVAALPGPCGGRVLAPPACSWAQPDPRRPRLEDHGHTPER
jgi:hypothetical protein